MSGFFNKYLLTSIALLLFVGLSSAQQTEVYEMPQQAYRNAIDLFEKEKYAAAQLRFEEVKRCIDDPSQELWVNSEYHIALCALELFNKDAEFLLTKFIADYPESPWVKPTYFQLARYNYRKKKYAESIEWFSKVDVYDLSVKELAEYYFKKGYSHFMRQEYASASGLFYQIKEVRTAYYGPSNYYYAHIAYLEGSYQTALESFMKLGKDYSYAAIVPYYITQIYFLQEKYDKVIDYAPKMMDSLRVKRAPEISRLVGESYYRTGQYEEAIPFLEQYLKETYKLKREDSYQLGYAYYKSGRYEKAVQVFQIVVNESDQLAQHTYYHMAECYIKLDQKNYARNAFLAASKLSFDQAIQEDALYNYAKLSYELSYNPYHGAANALKGFLKAYPNSEKKGEIYELLSNVYLSSHNYDEALQALDEIENKDVNLMTAYQLVAFNKGVQSYQKRAFGEAVSYFEKSFRYPVDQQVNLKARYWMAESYYHMRDYEKAIATYKSFQREPGAVLSPWFYLADYNMGYAYFKSEAYAEAISSFRKYIGQNRKKDGKRINDTQLRVADAYYLERDYFRAVMFYDEALKAAQSENQDYALYYSALCKGLLGEKQEKVRRLEKVIAGHQGSKYLADAKFQLGKTLLQLDEDDKARNYFTQVIEEFPSSPLKRDALLQLGLVHMRNKRNHEALIVFKQVVQDYPSYENSRDALASIKSIYVEMGNMEDYNGYVESLSFAKISPSEMDSANYEAAELLFANGDCERATAAFERYLEKFNPGLFSTHAHFYIGECAHKDKAWQKAMTAFQYVTNQPLNQFTEPALRKLAQLNHREENYALALNNYLALAQVAKSKSNLGEALIGAMRCYSKLADHSNTVVKANEVLGISEMPETIFTEAHLLKGNALFAMDSLDLALKAYQKILTKDNVGTQAKYQMAAVHHKKGDFVQSEHEIFELVQEYGGDDYWRAKAFILLADNYVELGDVFQAKATLQSVIDYHEGEELVELAQNKLAELIAKEKQELEENEATEPEEIELEFDNYERDYDKLFEEEPLNENEKDAALH